MSLVATEEKLDQIDRRARRAVQLNMPSFPDIVAHIVNLLHDEHEPDWGERAGSGTFRAGCSSR
ncbi:hypothetical protein ACETU7_03330 [Rhodococcus sp. 3Y1]